MFIHYEELYLKKHHIQLPRKEPDYAKNRHHAVTVALSSKNNIIREKASQNLKINMCQFQRLLHQFQEDVIPGLRCKSKRPHRSPNQIPS